MVMAKEQCCFLRVEVSFEMPELSSIKLSSLSLGFCLGSWGSPQLHDEEPSIEFDPLHELLTLTERASKLLHGSLGRHSVMWHISRSSAFLCP